MAGEAARTGVGGCGTPRVGRNDASPLLPAPVAHPKSRAVSTHGLPLVKLRLILGTVVAMILLHATPPTPLPTYRDHGSAFSASTSEVAVLLRRDSEESLASVPQPQPLPLPPPPLLAVPPTVFTADGVRPSFGWHPYRREPPDGLPTRTDPTRPTRTGTQPQ